jgi:predicted small metal-binding protein
MVAKVVKCDCGFTVRSENDDKLVADLQVHAREHHKMNLTRDQVLAMARPDPGPDPKGRKP